MPERAELLGDEALKLHSHRELAINEERKKENGIYFEKMHEAFSFPDKLMNKRDSIHTRCIDAANKKWFSAFCRLCRE